MSIGFGTYSRSCHSWFLFPALGSWLLCGEATDNRRWPLVSAVAVSLLEPGVMLREALQHRVCGSPDWSQELRWGGTQGLSLVSFQHLIKGIVQQNRQGCHMHPEGGRLPA